MKIYLAFKFTGEEVTQLTEKLNRLSATLRSAGHEVYCSIEDEDFFHANKYSNKDILTHELKHIDTSDVVLAFIETPERSEGMLVEIGYTIGEGKPFILLVKKGIKTTTIHQVAKSVIEFDTVTDLCEKLSKISL